MKELDRVDLNTKFHRLDPRHIYKSFMSAIVFQGEKDKVENQCNGRLSPAPGPGGPLIPIPALSKNFQLSRFELFSTKVASEEEEATETLRCLWPFFRLSRVIGMCPITRRGTHLVVGKYYHGSWIATWIALFLQIIMVGNAIKQAQKAETTELLVKRMNQVIYYGHTMANCCYMMYKIRELPQFIVACKRIENVCKKHLQQVKPDHLVRDCFILFLFFTLSQMLGNALYFASVASKAKAMSIGQFFKSFNSDFIGHWGGFYSGVFFAFGDLYCDMGWGFADILLAILSVVFGRFFMRLNTILRNQRTYSSLSLAKIEELRCDHREICHLVQICNNIFSPLFLLTYVANIGYLFTRLYTGLSDDLEDPTFTVRFESMYAFCYQILVKILTPSYLASRLHEKAHEGLKLIHHWPSAIDSPDSKCRLLVIGRFVSQLVTTPVGISGCGYFIISKSFMVTLISALVTYEVIILQFQGASLKSE